MDDIDFGINLKPIAELKKHFAFRDSFSSEDLISDYSLLGLMEKHSFRKKFIAQYGFVVYSLELVEALCAFTASQENSKVLEAGAGSGYLSKMLQDKGIDIKALEPGGPTFKGY